MRHHSSGFIDIIPHMPGTSGGSPCWNTVHWTDQTQTVPDKHSGLGRLRPGKSGELCLTPGVFPSWGPGCTQTFPAGCGEGCAVSLGTDVAVHADRG